MKINISIPGQPIAKARPRFARRGKFVNTYSPQHTEEGLWILTARQQLEGVNIFERPLYVKMVFWLSRPKSHFGKKGLKPWAPEMPTGKPDVSNMQKFVEDCLNECFIWPDDSFIVDVEARKRYVGEHEKPSTEIEIADEI